MLIYKILTPEQMADYRSSDLVPLVPVDEADGYVHLSTAAQTAETARRYFSEHPAIWLVSVEADLLSHHLKWEPSRGGELFPHFYGQLGTAHVTAAVEIIQTNGAFVFPPEITP